LHPQILWARLTQGKRGFASEGQGLDGAERSET